MPGWMCGCVNLQDTEGGDELQLRITDIAWREMSVVRMRPRMFPGKHPYSGFLKERSTLDVSITHLPVPLWSTDTDVCASARPPPPDQRTSPGFCVCWLLKAHSCFRFPKSCPPADRSHSAPWGLNWQPQGKPTSYDWCYTKVWPLFSSMFLVLLLNSLIFLDLPSPLPIHPRYHS